MKHISPLFGAFEYTEDQVITFPKGLLAFPERKHFVLKKTAKTEPILWLLSVDEGGPDFAIVEPSLLDKRSTVEGLHVGRETRTKLGARTDSDLKMYAIVTVPDDIRRISMNLRTPILICPRTRLGIQRQDTNMRTRAVRKPIYRELTGDEVERTTGQLVLHRKLNETVKIGEDIVVEVLALEDGGVRLGISAPKDIRIRRGENNVDPITQMVLASEPVDIPALAALLRESRGRVDKAAV